ncbi:MAG: response regulator [Microcoleus sp. PH2017_10_PVI_O_A]|nr:response regulator [Microcoleus sp. PH2017_10_PVI_O_A]MCC3462919.1 response regulator [Microcoleus sp. PH2017_11_PCY_U_A]MCC3482169.1 response regulator [Microcoleus sp. PH2017_12_PCY_D_A]MCC3530983.1 response regulator [Microcoleus sp. PH2017_21_RUC_O_A]MCC3543340.1 response regulator [Microcoleus sp. PH2017_22_RUC_O_B]MCC3562345.1 response regulator [Microcoleus sp. PH2017_27_LUM_O_A]TAE76158.1 MAG: response regulator [Oscillatoriales cyanobacterium]
MRILLVEDDTLLSATLAKVLETNDYTLDRAIDGQAGLDLATLIEYDLILLDVQVPKLDGISLCRQLRSQNYRNPILLLTAKDSDADVVALFDAGADDYINKPYGTEVLLARIRTLLRRSKAVSPGSFAKDSSAALTWGHLCLDMDSGRVSFGEQLISLTAKEYNLLELFMRNPDRIFSRSAILDRLWGFDDAPTDRAINTHIKDIRKKLKAGGLTEEMIETVYGMGYRLKPPPQPAPLAANNSAIDRTSKHKSRAGDRSAIDKVLERFRGVFQQQIAVLSSAKTALMTGKLEMELYQSAKNEAHKLAGSMASFGYPEGSKLARSAEHLLISISPVNPSGILRPFTAEETTRFSELVTELEQELAKAAVTLTTSPVPTVVSHRVLVVDDDAALTECLKAESEARGFRIKIAPNVAAARSRLAMSMPDLILIDLSFPDTEEDGLTLLRELNERSPNLPIIVFTGRDSLGDRLAASRLGAKQFLHKPATTDQIFQAISRISTKTKAPQAKVLIVDDDPAILAHLSALLTPWGLEVITLTEPQGFWEMLLTTSPNLVILDLEMPQVSGLELCQVVRQDTQRADLPVLVVTARTDADSLTQAFAAGADDFITKPVLGPELVTRVLSRIERNRSRTAP